MVDGAVGDNDIAPFGKRRDDARDGGEGLRVHDAGRLAEEGGDVGFGLDVHVLRAVEAGRTAGADAVGPQGLDGFFLEGVVRDEVVEVVGGEVRDGAVVAEFDFGAGGTGQRVKRCQLNVLFFGGKQLGLWKCYLPDNDWSLFVFCFFKGCLWRDERFGCPVFDELVNLLQSNH